MTKVLVAEDDRHIRGLLVDIAFDAGYDVIEARDGAEALKLVAEERPDIILLDVWMPLMDGFEVLTKLRGDPVTKGTPVIFLTVLPAVRGELRGMDLGVHHYITKPWEPGIVEAAIKVGLLDAASPGSSEEEEEPPSIWQGSAASHKANGKSLVFGTAEKLPPLEHKLDGGLPLGSLTVIEGTASSGKSVLCQHLAYGALADGHGLAYYTSDYSTGGLIDQMGSIGLGVLPSFQEDALRIVPIAEPSDEGDADQCDDAERLLAALAADIERLPGRHKLVVVDNLTNLAGYSPERGVIRFLTACRRLCNKGRTIVRPPSPMPWTVP